MAFTITWRHQKKLKNEKGLKKILSWLRAAASLSVIMGLTWIFGLLVLDYPGAEVLAFIYVILVGFQGTFIFLLFVVFSKAVREAYVKFWDDKVRESDILSKYFGDTTLTMMVRIYILSCNIFIY